ncbi:hypothetical protein GIW81_00790 [Hyphomicrobium sp. xq]|uniref:Uncharacterized protein n=1 Tax=Hyphomicrobium album TaxID=2665159 RepID=A0A6I3KDD6_9HYPH|nr:hypothetical protein [Hyphomicrobium album]MTD92864.1 hypothetical protein [Hyphomicrobium album]
MTIHTKKARITDNATAAPSVTGPLASLVEALKFCRPAISTEETRYYLNTVCIYWNPAGLVAVSTDGHRLHNYPLSPKGTPDGLTYQFLLKRDDVAKILKTYNTKGKQRDKTYAVHFAHPQSNAGPSTLLFAGHESFKPLDATFPDWQRVVPRDVLPSLHWHAEDAREVFNVLAAYDRGYAVRIAGNTEGGTGGTLKLERKHFATLRAGHVDITHSTTIDTGVAVARNFEVGYQAGYAADIVKAFAELHRDKWREERYGGTLVTLSLPEDDSFGPGMWRVGDAGAYVVLMPMRI